MELRIPSVAIAKTMEAIPVVAWNEFLSETKDLYLILIPFVMN